MSPKSLSRIVGVAVVALALPALAPSPRGARAADAEEVVDLTLDEFSGLGKRFTNGVGMKLVRIPRGRFMMGAPKEDKLARPDEKYREVTIAKDYYLGAYEVTQKQYKTVMGYNPSFFSEDGEPAKGARYEYNQPAGGKDQVKGLDTSDFPVENVAYEDAEKFLQKLNDREKARRGAWRYAIPTEAQWEYACRAGAASYRRYSFGDAITPKDANYGMQLRRPCKVGSYRPNAWGLYDMHGNVWEMTADYYDKEQYRSVRGGDWYCVGESCRSAHRSERYRGFDRCYYLGFRVALVQGR
jgi:formylglycine-generating enzyme required for sulfatase activity